MTPEWSMVPLGDLASRLTSRNGLAGESNVLTISAQRGLVSQERYFSKRVASENLSQYFLLKRGDFAYNKSYSEGYPAGAIKRLDASESGVVSPLYICFRLERNGLVESDYLVHYVEGGRLDAQLRSIAKEGARNHGLLNVKPSEFFALSVTLPPLSEQRKIAAIFSSVDDAIESTQAVIDQLGVVKKAMMAELLTRGLPGRHTKFKQTEIGELPEEWEVVRMAEISAIERGKFSHRPRNDPRFFGGPHPYVQTGDVAASGGRITRHSQTLSDDGLAVSRMFPAGTIVITIAANIGDTGIATYPVAFPDSLVGIQSGSRVNAHFLELVLRTRKKLLEDAAPQNAQKNINLETLRPLRIQLPPLQEQVELAAVIGSVADREEAEVAFVRQLKIFKADLMSVLLTGELRVTPDGPMP